MPVLAEYDAQYLASDTGGPGHREASWHNSLDADLVCTLGLFAADVVAFVAAQVFAVWLASLTRQMFAQPQPEPASWVTQIAPDVPMLMALFGAAAIYLAARGCYRERLPFWHELRLFVLVSTVALFAESFVQVALKGQPSRLILVGVWVLFPPCVAVTRPLAKRTLSFFSLWHVPLLAIGTPADIRGMEDVLGSERTGGFEVVASFSAEEALAELRRTSWSSMLRHSGARRLMLSLQLGVPAELKIIQSIMRAGVPFSVLPQINVLPVVGCERIPFFSHDTVLLCFRNNLSRAPARFMKALFDILVSATLLLVLSPLFLFLILAIRRDGGPAFFSHTRLGARGRPFGCLKFRTMVMNADLVLQEALAADELLAAEWDQTQKLRHDPRITGIGRVLRATSLDELPQLINVICLQMSLVGPRPIVAAEAARYGEDIAFYYETRPGLTGLWQVSGRADTTYSKRVKLDCWYVKNWTMWHDIAILAKTVPAVLSRRGAH